MNRNFGFDYGRQIVVDRRRSSLIAFLNHLSLAPVTDWSEIHANGNKVGNKKVYSRIQILGQDYSSGKKSNSIFCTYNFSVWDIRNLKNIVSMRYAEYQRKFFKVVSQKGTSTFSECIISRNPQMNNPWSIEIINGVAQDSKPDRNTAKRVTQRFSEDGFFDLITQVDKFIDLWEFTFGQHLLVEGYSNAQAAIEADKMQREQNMAQKQQYSNGYTSYQPPQQYDYGQQIQYQDVYNPAQPVQQQYNYNECYTPPVRR